jgi:hypothetical protein
MPAPPFEIADLRRPGSPMVALAVKLPPDMLEALRGCANGLGCSHTALARALIVRGLGDLENSLSSPEKE